MPGKNTFGLLVLSSPSELPTAKNNRFYSNNFMNL